MPLQLEVGSSLLTTVIEMFDRGTHALMKPDQVSSTRLMRGCPLGVDRCCSLDIYREQAKELRRHARDKGSLFF